MKYHMELIVTAADGGSVLRDAHLLEMDKLNYFILDNFTVSFERAHKVFIPLFHSCLSSLKKPLSAALPGSLHELGGALL